MVTIPTVLMFTAIFASAPRIDTNIISNIVIEQPQEEIVEESEIVPETYISEDDVYLLALVTMAEAESEPEEGKRLVIDTVLNRVDHPYYPDTVSEVIYQKGQFGSMWNGRVKRCTVNDYVINLVREEAFSRGNHDVIYFTAERYSNYGTPLFSVGNHYFSSY